jgi:hypothetical protein
MLQSALHCCSSHDSSLTVCWEDRRRPQPAGPTSWPGCCPGRVRVRLGPLGRRFSLLCWAFGRRVRVSGCFGANALPEATEGPTANADNSGWAFSVRLIWTDSAPTSSGSAAGGHRIGITAANVATTARTPKIVAITITRACAHARWFSRPQMVPMADDGSKWCRWRIASPNGGSGGCCRQMVAMVVSSGTVARRRCAANGRRNRRCQCPS